MNGFLAQGQMMVQSFLNAQAQGMQALSTALQQGQANMVNSANAAISSIGQVATAPLQFASSVGQGAGFTPSGFFPRETANKPAPRRGTARMPATQPKGLEKGGVGLTESPLPVETEQKKASGKPKRQTTFL